MNEDQLTKIAVIGSIVTIILIYVFVSFVSPEVLDIGEIGIQHRGKVVNAIGKIKNMNHENGNIFFTLYDETGEINVVLWSNIVKALEMQGTNLSSLRENDTVSISGGVNVHRGYLQIVPARPSVSLVE